MNKGKNGLKKQDRSFDEGTHPGAYIDDYDVNNKYLDTVDSADDTFTEKISPKGRARKSGKPANSASVPAADPPVPNRAHTEM